MLAIHDQCTRQVRTRLKTTVMGLGLVRLLQDAGRYEEARAILLSLENGFPCKAKRLQKISASPALVGLNERHELVHCTN